MNNNLFNQREINRKFTAVYIEYFDYVCRLLNKEIRDYDTAEDIAQNIFINVYNNIEKIQYIKGWLHNLVRFELGQLYRKKEKTHEIITEDIEIQQVFDGDSVIIVRETVTAVLDEYEITIITLACCYNEMFTSIAEQLKTTRRKVKIAYDNGIRKLRNYLRHIGICHMWEIC